jgi:hypothetical protein
MKNLIKGVVILNLLSLFGCSKTLYTHDEVLGRYKTKQDVQKTFGIPTEKSVSDTSERWLYSYDKRHNVELHQNTQTATVNEFGKYERFLIFSFDKKDNVVRYDYTGIDLAVRKKKTGATIALIGGAVAVTAIAIIAATVNWNNTAGTINLFGE